MSEEQFKIFSLPALNPTGKYKVLQISLVLRLSFEFYQNQVTANEGVVVRRTRTTALESLGVSLCLKFGVSFNRHLESLKSCCCLVEPRSDGQLPSLPLELGGDLSLLPAGPQVPDEGGRQQ